MTSWRNPLANATPSKAAKTVVLMIAALLLAALSGITAVGQITRFKAPHVAVGLPVIDGIAPAILADQLLTRTGNDADLNTVKTLALGSLRREPLNPAALRLLGQVADAQGEAVRALKLLNLSNAQSRRDLGAQLWLIQRNSQRGDIAGTLVHYDAALRATPQSYQILLPVLTTAIDDPDIRREATRFIAANPPWLASFINFAAERSTAPRNLAALLIAARTPVTDNAPLRPSYGNVLRALDRARDYPAARRFAAFMANGQSTFLDQATISATTTNPDYAPLTWDLANQPGIEARLNLRGDLVNIYAAGDQRGTALQRTLFLVPGSYAVAIAERLVASSPGSQRTWRVECLNAVGSTSLWENRADSFAPSTQVRAEFTVSAGCAAQRISLNIVGGSGADGLEFDVTRIEIKRR